MNIPDPYDDDEDELDQQQEQQRESKDIRQLRAKAKRADGLEAELKDTREKLTRIEREQAMRRVGIDLESSTGKLFYKAYDGVDTDDAIRAAAVEYGVLAEHTDAEQQREAALGRLGSSAAGQPAGAVGSITGESYAAWPRDLRDRFRIDHPREFGALKRGETIAPIAGYPT